MEVAAGQQARFAILACPNCGGPIRSEASEFRCAACGPVGKVLDVPCFTDPDYYWGEVSREQMQEANRLAAEKGWRAAVDQVVPNPKLHEYICDPRRADFQYIWDLPADSTILDVGAGWGAIATTLGGSFARVVAVEGVLERARFIQHRVRALPAPTVEVICGDFLRLPLAPAQFDAAVLNGVVEWVGLASPQGDPRDLQLKFLRRIHDLLKPSGFVCMGIENRVGWSGLRYGTDHSGLPYTNLMPRGMADMWCRWHSRRYRSDLNKGYRTYTYGLGGYHKLLQEAGFSQIRSFHAWDGYNYPSVLLPLDDRQALVHFVQRRRWEQFKLGKIRQKAAELWARSGLWGEFASEFIFLAKRS